MTNNYSTLKNKNATEKFYLVRINPIRSILNDLVLVSGNTYTMVFPYVLTLEIKINAITCTKVTTPTNFGEYSFDETTGVFVIVLGAALAFYQATGNITVSYYLFFTNGINRYALETPDDPLTSTRLYEARLISAPEFSITQEDIIDRVFTIGNTSIQLINSDGGLNEYLTDNDSFYRRDIKIWRCLDDKENISKLYFGVCSGITVGENIIISIDNNLSICTDNFFSNNNFSDSSFYIENFPLLNIDDSGKPIYKLYAERSPTVVSFDPTYGPGGGSYQNIYDITDGFTLTNISYDEVDSGTTNRTWAACLSSSSSSTLTETVAGVSYDFISYRVTVADKFKYRAGDQVELFNGSWAQGFFIYKLDYVSADNYIYIQGTNPADVVANGNLIRRNAISQISLLYGSVIYNLSIVRDYNVSVSNGIYIITFVNNFETGLSDPLDTGKLHRKSVIYYRVNNHDDCNHGTVLKSMLNKVGILCDSTSYSDANLTLFKTNFSIPRFKETSFVSLVEILQLFLSSTFGYITIDSDFLVRYYLLNSPSNSTIITDNEIIEGSLSQEIKYSDIVSTVSFENINGENVQSFAVPAIILDTTKEDLVSDIASTYLYGSNRSTTIKYIMQYLANSKQNILNVLKSRRHSIGFTTKGINFESMLGDDITVQSSKLIGGVSSRNYKILSITQNAESTTIRAVDLLGL